MSSTELAVPRVGQIGTVITAIIDEPDPNNPGQYLLVDLTDAVLSKTYIEFMRPDKTRFTVPATSIPSPPTSAQVQVVDDAGILNQAGTWQFRGVAVFTNGSKFPGSWYIQLVGT